MTRSHSLVPRLGLSLLLGLTVLGVGAVDPPAASAAGACHFRTTGTVMRLRGDCITTTSILVPDGFTLNGRGHSITAVDPSGDRFRGGVITNSGSSAFIHNVSVVGASANTECGAAIDDKYRGIFLNEAWGSVVNSRVTNINLGAGSTCDEGNSIVIQRGPYDGTHPDTKPALIAGNVIQGFQRFGIFAQGDLSPTIRDNAVTAEAGTSPPDGHFGIMTDITVGGRVASNSVDAGFVENTVNANALVITDTVGALIEGNVVTGSNYGLTLQSLCASPQTSSGNIVRDNKVTGAAEVGLYLLSQTLPFSTCDSGVDDNTVVNNTVDANGGLYGVFILPANNGNPAFNPTAMRNKVTNNTISGAVIPIDDLGTDNTTSPNTIIP